MRDRYDDERYYMQDVPCVTMLREHLTRARKPHKCGTCGGPIAKGVQYLRFVYVDHEDHDAFHSEAMHYQCPMEEVPF